MNRDDRRIRYSRDPAPRDRQIIARFGNAPNDYPVKARYVDGAWNVLGNRGSVVVETREPVEWRDVPKMGTPAKPHSIGQR
jgi:hypothetical protein